MKYGKELKEALDAAVFIPTRAKGSLSPGKAIRIYREAQNLSQSELAEKAGLTQATISGLENNRISLGLERAKAIARALKIHPSVIAFPDWDIEEESVA